MTDLPRGFNSDAPLPVSGLLDIEQSSRMGYRPDFWYCAGAVSYDGLEHEASYSSADRLGIALPVTGKHVLLLDTITDRPGLVSQCAHLVRSEGAAWVGYLALLHVEDLA